MTSRIVITDDDTGKDIPPNHEYYEVAIRRNTDRYGDPTSEYCQYASWGSVLKKLSIGGAEEVTIYLRNRKRT